MSLTIRAMTREPADCDVFAACFARNGSPRNPDVFRWQYLDNPTRQLFVDLALAPDGRAAAIYATLPVRMRIDGAVQPALQSVDTMTDADFRGQGLFLQLAQTTYARAGAAGSRVVYGFPNGKSAHGFFERLGWTNLDPVPFMIRPLRTSYALRQLRAGRIADRLPDLRLYRSRIGRMSRGRIERITRFDERATALWETFSKNVGIAVERDATYLNWRLVDKPHERYIIDGVFDGDALRAFVCYTVKEKHGGHVGYVMETLCVPGWERELRALLHRAVVAMGDAGADVALAWCFAHSPTFGVMVRGGFVPFPEKLRPIELHFGARALTAPNGSEIATRRDRWYLSYVDADTT